MLTISKHFPAAVTPCWSVASQLHFSRSRGGGVFARKERYVCTQSPKNQEVPHGSHELGNPMVRHNRC